MMDVVVNHRRQLVNDLLSIYFATQGLGDIMSSGKQFLFDLLGESRYCDLSLKIKAQKRG